MEPKYRIISASKYYNKYFIMNLLHNLYICIILIY